MKWTKTSIAVSLVVSSLFISMPTIAAESDDAYNKAVVHLNKNDINSGIIELKNSLQNNPKNVASRLLLGETYLKINRWAAAEKELLKVKELGSDKRQWMKPLAQAFASQGKIREIKDIILHEQKDDSSVQAETLAILGKVESMLGNFEEAKSKLTQALTLDETNTEARLALGSIAFQQLDYEKGLAYAEQVVAAEKGNLEGLLLKSQLLAALGKMPEAFVSLQTAIDEKPQFIEARVLRTNINISLKQLDAAKSDIDYLAQILPDHFLTELLSGKYFLAKNDFEKADELLQSAQSKTKGELPELQKLLGLLDINNKNWEQAEIHLSSALRLSPNDKAVALLLANLYASQLSMPEKAIDMYQKLNKSYPSDQSIIVGLADALLKSGKEDKATELLEQAILNSDDPNALKTVLAQTKFTTGNINEAISLLEESAKAGSASLDNAWLIMSYIKAENFAKAEELSLTILKDKPDNVLFTNLLGRVYLASKQFDKALNYFNKAVAMKADYIAAHFNIVKIYEEQNDFSKLLEKLTEMEKQFKENTRIAYGLYRTHLSKKNEVEAQKWLELSVKRDATFAPAVIELINYYLNRKEFIEASAYANQFIAADKRNAEAHFQLGRVYISERDNSQLSKAIESLQNAVTIAPDDPKYTLALASAYLRENNRNEALSAYNRFLINVPVNDAIFSNKIRLLIKDKKFSTAKRSIKDYVIASKNEALTTELLGDIETNQVKPLEAIKYYEKAYELRASSRLVQKLHAQYNANKMDDKAEMILVSWLKSNENDVSARFTLANWAQRQKRNQQAIVEYEKILDTNPEYVLAMNNLAWMYMEENNPRAIEIAEQIKKLDINQADVLDTIGWIYVQFDKADVGLPILEKAITLNADLREARYHLAVAHFKTGNGKAAKEIIQKLVSSGKPFYGREDAEALLSKM